MPALTKTVKTIVILCVVIFLLQSLGPTIDRYLGFTPALFLRGMIWQPITYMFLHGNLWHLLLNMMVFTMFGVELERIWGTRFFLIYFFGCGIGSILVHLVGTIFFLPGMYIQSVVGASGAIYGLLLAYGILFPERQLLFMLIFPMKAKYFVLVAGAIELYLTVTQSGGNIANLVHLSGIVVGYLILWFETRRRNRNKNGSSGSGGFFSRFNSKKRHLKIVINND